MAGRVTIDQFKSQLGRPSLTSKYYVEIPLPASTTGGSDNAFKNFAKAQGFDVTTDVQRNINLYCSEASLPGSSIATLEQTSDRTGVTERHAHRRVFDDRIDLTFYVDGDNYTVIKYFETWIDFISGSGTTQDNKKLNENYFYRMNYPDEYTCSGFKVTKFESDSFKNINPTGGSLVYNFVKAFPISINSMPISYDTSQLLKCTVSMTYLRYVIERTTAQTPPAKKTPQPKVPEPQPKDSSSSAQQFFNDNRSSLLKDKNGSTFNFDLNKFGPQNTDLNPNVA
tara:strand:- start:28 stop:876 length:849 start_codon:yes stop_codon:yes gene_type:complete